MSVTSGNLVKDLLHQQNDRHHHDNNHDSETAMNTSLSTLDQSQDLFHHSITDLESFSTSLDLDRHLPSVEEREDFLNSLIEDEDEEEINPLQESFQSSFAYDFDMSRGGGNNSGRLVTIPDCDFSEEDDDADTENAGVLLSKSNHAAATPATNTAKV